MNCCWPESLLFLQTPSLSTVCLLVILGHENLPCPVVTSVVTSVVTQLSGWRHTSTGGHRHLLGVSGTCPVLSRQSWKGILSQRHGQHPKLGGLAPEAALPREPWTPSRSRVGSPEEGGFVHKKSSKLSWCKLAVVSGSGVKNAPAGWMGRLGGLLPPRAYLGPPGCWGRAAHRGSAGQESGWV